MKVKRLWRCDCGETSVLQPAGEPHKIIVKEGYHLGNHDAEQWIACRSCRARWPLLPVIARANSLRKVWECDHTRVLKSETGELLIQGPGFKYGSPITHIRCSECSRRCRVAPDLVFYGQLKAKKAKRTKSRKNRRAKKRRARG